MTTVTREIHFAVKGKRKCAIVGPAPEKPEPQGRIPRISKLMALAIRFDQLLKEGVVPNQSELARLAHVTQPRMTQIMNLLNLAPDIQEEILFLPTVNRGSDPITERDVRNVIRQARWSSQRLIYRQLHCDTSRTVHTDTAPSIQHAQSAALSVDSSACFSTSCVASSDRSGG